MVTIESVMSGIFTAMILFAIGFFIYGRKLDKYLMGIISCFLMLGWLALFWALESPPSKWWILFWLLIFIAFLICLIFLICKLVQAVRERKEVEEYIRAAVVPAAFADGGQIDGILISAPTKDQNDLKMWIVKMGVFLYEIGIQSGCLISEEKTEEKTTETT
ncbi:MAG: hypothetical protein ACOX06_01000 [Candidatus Dojkabacteria bacterium]|jgi:Ca2+/Na+ antiporter